MGAFGIGKKIKSVKKPKVRVVAGVLLIIAAVVNILARVDVGTSGWVVDGVITAVLFVSGITLLKYDKWLPVGVFALACSIIGIFYPLIKFYTWYTIAPETGWSFQEILPGLSVFITTCVLCVLAAALILKWKFSKS